MKAAATLVPGRWLVSGVAVGGMGVAVGGRAVAVGGTAVAVGGTGVEVGCGATVAGCVGRLVAVITGGKVLVGKGCVGKGVENRAVMVWFGVGLFSITGWVGPGKVQAAKNMVKIRNATIPFVQVNIASSSLKSDPIEGNPCYYYDAFLYI